MHNPQRVHLFSESMKFTLRFSPMAVGGEKNRFSGHISTQSLHLIHNVLSMTISFKEIHYNSVISYLLDTLNSKLCKYRFNFIPSI